MYCRKAENYSSNAQRIRVITEDWVNNNMFCPYCGNQYISHFENNRPVADFFCPSCMEEYELKSKGASIGNKVNDGAYNTMIERITSINNPNFFFMHYNKTNFQVEKFCHGTQIFFLAGYNRKEKAVVGYRKEGWLDRMQYFIEPNTRRRKNLHCTK